MTDKRGLEYGAQLRIPGDKRGIEFSAQVKFAPPDRRGIEYSAALKLPSNGNRPFYYTESSTLHGVVGYLKVGGSTGTQVQIT